MEHVKMHNCSFIIHKLARSICTYMRMHVNVPSIQLYALCMLHLYTASGTAQDIDGL